MTNKANRAIGELQPLVDHDVPGTPARAAPSDAKEFGFAVEYGRVPYRAANGKTLWGYVSITDYEMIEFLKADAAAHLPPGTRFEIRRKIPCRDAAEIYVRSKQSAVAEVGRSGMAWYRCEDESSPDYTDAELALGSDSREYVVGIHVTPYPAEDKSGGDTAAEKVTPDAVRERLPQSYEEGPAVYAFGVKTDAAE